LVPEELKRLYEILKAQPDALIKWTPPDKPRKGSGRWGDWNDATLQTEPRIHTGHRLTQTTTSMHTASYIKATTTMVKTVEVVGWV